METTWQAWWAMDDAQRAVVVDELLERMPPGYVDPRAVGHRAAALPQFIHRETNVLFHVVFGGEAVIGMSDARLHRLRKLRHRDADDEYAMVPLPEPGEDAPLRPARRVVVPTSLVADEPLQWGQLVKLGLDEAVLGIRGVLPVGVGALLRAVTRLGWRAPSEAQWEYACRCVEDVPGDDDLPLEATGRLVGTGLLNLGDHLELCRDDWHDDFGGAPASHAWGQGHEVLRGRGVGARFGGWNVSAAWAEALWPGRRRVSSWTGQLAFRPWVELGA